MFINRLRRGFIARDASGLTDVQLLEHIISPLKYSRGETDRDLREAAFEALVRRHGPMVLSVCRRVLGHFPDAEDAFQATFLVLFRKARSIRNRKEMGGWLYRVAYRTALAARKVRARRHKSEKLVGAMANIESRSAEVWHDVLPHLDQALEALPDKYRIAVVLCDLEGKSVKEAARQLECPAGTVSSRLTRGREMLRRKLLRKGIGLSVSSLAVMFSEKAALASVPSQLISNTIQAAATAAAGATAAGIVSTKVVALAEGVMKAMLIGKLKKVTVIAAAMACLVPSSALITYQTLVGDEPRERSARQITGTPSAETKRERETKGNLKDTLVLLEQRSLKAWLKHDTDALDKLIADDVIVHDPTLGRVAKAEVLQSAKMHTYDEYEVTMAMDLIRLSKDSAIVTYETKWRGKGPHPYGGVNYDHCRVTNGWAQRDGGWFIVFSQNAPIAHGANDLRRIFPLKPADSKDARPTRK